MLALTVSLFAVAAMTSWWRLPALHPAQLWLTSWLLALALFALHLLPYGPLANKTLLMVVIATTAFVFATFVAPRLVAPRGGISLVKASHTELAGASLLAVALAGWGIFMAQAVRTSGIRDALLTSASVRGSILEGQYTFAIKYVYFAIAAAVMCAVAAGVVPPRRRRWLLAAGLAVVCTYFATGRATVVTTAFAAVVAFLLAGDVRLPLRRVLLGAAAAGLLSLLLFVVMGQLVGKTYANSDLGTVRSFFTEHPDVEALGTPYMYASAPIGALNVLVQNPPADRSDGCAMLSVVCVVLSHAGLEAKPTPPIRPFTADPIPWNTYTALDDAIRDFGFLGVPIVFSLLGLVCGWLWVAVRRGRLGGTAVYAVISTSIITSAGANSFAAGHVLGAMGLALVSLAAAMVFRISIAGDD